MLNNLISEMSLVRNGNQPPTFPLPVAASGHCEPFFLGGSLPSITSRAMPVALAAAAASMLLWGVAGCQTPIAVEGGYNSGGEEITGGIQTSTNSLTVEGDFTDGGTNVGGAVTIGK